MLRVLFESAFSVKGTSLLHMETAQFEGNISTYDRTSIPLKIRYRTLQAFASRYIFNPRVVICCFANLHLHYNQIVCYRWCYHHFTHSYQYNICCK
jgi:hypothetical protein